MKKKLLIMTLACALILSMSACGSKELGQLKDALSDLSENLETENESSSTESEVAELGTFTFDIPEGFIELSEGYYEHENQLDLSTINYLTQPNDGSFSQVGGAVMVQAIELQLESAHSTDLTINLIEEEFYKIDGVDAFKYTIEYDLMDFHFRQTQVIVNDPENFHFVTCTLINDENYQEAFDAFLDSLRFE